MDWTAETDFHRLAPDHRAELQRLPVRQLPAGQPLFHPGDRAEGFLILLQGRVEVFLTGPSGREILLYAVEPGETCVQTTLGLLGPGTYSGAAVTATDCRAVMVPRGTFLRLMEASAQFRSLVFQAFGNRMADMTRLLEQVAFVRVESRLAAALLHLAQDRVVRATQGELATQIGSAREVVSRKLEGLARRGLITTERGCVHLIDPEGLSRIATADVT